MATHPMQELKRRIAERLVVLDESTLDKLLFSVGSEESTQLGHDDLPFLDRLLAIEELLQPLFDPDIERLDTLLGAIERDAARRPVTPRQAPGEDKVDAVTPPRPLKAEAVLAEREAATGGHAVSDDWSNTIFVVHGHAGELKYQVARVIDHATKRRAIILHEQANSGRTIIEKFEHHAGSAAYAVVLLTGDDLGGAKADTEQRLRARQNVVLELGFFFGALGRERVTVLLEPGVEEPSDIAGLAYLPVDPGGVWRYDLGKELRAAGIDFDAGQVP